MISMPPPTHAQRENMPEPQEEVERGELAAYREYFEAVEHSRDCAGMHCYEIVHHGKVRDETKEASDAANERIRVAKERIASLPAASSAEGQGARIPSWLCGATADNSPGALREYCTLPPGHGGTRHEHNHPLGEPGCAHSSWPIKTDVAPPATTARGLPTIYAVFGTDGTLLATDTDHDDMVACAGPFGASIVAYPPPVDREKAREAIEGVLQDYPEGLHPNYWTVASRILAAIGLGGG